MTVPSPYRTAWPVNAPKVPANLRLVLDDIESRLDAGSTSAYRFGSKYGLLMDGSTDETASVLEKIQAAMDDGLDRIIFSGEGSDELVIDGFLKIPNPPRKFKVVFDVKLAFGKGGEIRTDADIAEFPTSDLYRLYEDVDTSGGTVDTIPLESSPQSGDVSEITVGRTIIIRGETDANGEVLDNHRHEAIVVSKTQVGAGTGWDVVIDPPLPQGFADGLLQIEYEASEQPTTDRTLITFAVEAALTSSITDSHVIPIGSGGVALFSAGDYVLVEDTTTGTDLEVIAGSSIYGTSNEPLQRQPARVLSKDSTNLYLDRPILGTVDHTERGRVTLLEPVKDLSIIGPGRGRVRATEAADASPASRIHFVNARYLVGDWTISGWFHDADVAGYDKRGAMVRTHYCLDGVVEGNGRANGIYYDEGGSANGIWDKGSNGTTFRLNDVHRVRHGLTFGGSTAIVCELNRCFGCMESALDSHGEGGRQIAIRNNLVIAGGPDPDRDRAGGIVIGNPTHCAGDVDVLVEGNVLLGFTGDDDFAIRVWSGSRRWQIKGNFAPLAARLFDVQADRRVPAMAIEEGLIDHHGAGGIGEAVVIDGSMPSWASETDFAGSATRPTCMETTEGAVWSTPDSGTSSTTEPVIGESPVVGTTTYSDGDLTWTLRSLTVYTPIDGIVITGDLSGADTPITQTRADNVKRGAAVIWADDDNGLTSSTVQGQLDELAQGVSPVPGIVESVAGTFVLDWDDDFGGPRTVTLARADADESESLLATLPEIPSGHWATIRITEAMSFQARSRTFAVAASWTDDEGAGQFTITESGVTTTTLGLAVGDAVSGGPLGSPTTISEIVSAEVFKTVAAAGETDSGTISIVAPAYSIDGSRQFGSPALGPVGAFVQFTVITASTATTRGLIQSAERPASDGAGISSVTTTPFDPKTTSFVLDASNTSDGVTSGALRSDRMIPVDSSGGAINATLDSDLLLEGSKWAVYVRGSNPVTLVRPATWYFERTGTLTLDSAIITAIDIENVLDGMGVDDLGDDSIPAATTVADADYDTDEIQMSADADASATATTIRFDAGKVGTIDGVSADTVLQPGLNIIHLVGYGETTGWIVETSVRRQLIIYGTPIEASRVAALSDGFKSTDCEHGSTPIVITVDDALHAAAAVGFWAEYTWEGVAAVSFAVSGSVPALQKRASRGVGIAERYGSVLLRKRDDGWRIEGNLADA